MSMGETRSSWKTSLEQVPMIRGLIEGIDQGQWQSLLSEMQPMDHLSPID